jgi:phosphoglycolate phosphatase
MNARLPGCILFDQDGTLLNSLPGIEFSVRTAFVACGLQAPEKSLRSVIGPPIRTILSKAGDVSDVRVLDALEKAFRVSYDSEGWQRTACFPDASRVLGTLRRRGHRLFVVSNKPLRISLQILKAEGILDLFEAVVTRDSRVPAYSGKAEMTRMLMEEHQFSPEDALLMGDTMEDAEAAAAAGIRFAFMTHGYGTIPENAPVRVDFRFDCFLQLLPLTAKELVHD